VTSEGTEQSSEVGLPISGEIRTVVDRTSAPIVILERSGVIRYANPAAGWLVGRAPSSMVGANVLAMVHSDDRPRFVQNLAEVVAGRGLGEPVEYRVRAFGGSTKTILATASNLLDLSSVAGVLVSASDVTDQRAQEYSLRKLALRDPVTGLANRVALADRLALEMSTSRPMAVAFVDVDHFTRINDCLGHTVGDAVLDALGSRIGFSIPAESLASHFGGDTFVVVLSGLDPGRATQLVWDLIGRLANPLFMAGHELSLTASAGLAFGDAASTPESILRDADVALTRSKTRGRGGVEVFTEAMRVEAMDRLAMETDLRYAIERNQMQLHLQPIVSLSSRQTEGSEALLRWTRAHGEQVGPSTFIPLAEETGLIVPLGEWVLGRALAALQSGRTTRVNVNLSPRQLLDPGLPARIERLVSAQGVKPERLSFEVTEEVVIEKFELATATLRRIRRLGCLVGLDDFGVGYSSLSYLRRLPVDFLKLDRELVEDVDTDDQAAAIAGTIVALAKTLSLATVAEGVEREAQADVLTSMGCDFGQGWLFGYPAPA
jgi:diguanylate cyclase (GGDEF)-like protein/PAS domain S-box-containing protein